MKKNEEKTAKLQKNGTKTEKTTQKGGKSAKLCKNISRKYNFARTRAKIVT